MNDLIADMIARIRNGAAVGKAAVVVPYSKINLEIARALEREGYVAESSKKTRKGIPVIEVAICYDEEENPLFTKIKRVSKLSRRLYSGVQDIKHPRGGRGSFVLTTPQGVLTDTEAKEKNVGGEVLLKIW